MARVAYDHRVFGSFLAIWDNSNEAEGAMSVTNAVEQVLAERIVEAKDRKVVYQDTDGLWDEIVHLNGRFKSFAPLRANSMEEAFEALRRKYPAQPKRRI